MNDCGDHRSMCHDGTAIEDRSSIGELSLAHSAKYKDLAAAG